MIMAKLTIQTVVHLHQAIESLRPQTLNKTLRWALMRTREKTLPIFEAVAEMEKPSEALTAFQKARVELIKAHMAPGADFSQPSIPLKDPEAFKTSVEALPGYTEAIAEMEETRKAVTEKCAEEVEIDLYMAPFETLPESFAGDGIWPMIRPPKEPNAPKPE